MKELAEILKITLVIDLINAKPLKRKSFICLHEQDTIKTALNTFISNEIESIPIKKTDPGSGYENEFVGIISLVNLLKFIYSRKQELSIQAFLDLKLSNFTKLSGFIQKIQFVDPELSLLNLILDVWGGACKPKTSQIDCSHLIVQSESGKYELITPLDFLRHLLFINANAMTCLIDASASEIENGFDVDENSVISWDEDVRIAVDRTIRSDPFFLLAVVDDQIGTLVANVTLTDFLPSDLSILEESISLIRRDGISLHAYVQTLQAPSRNYRKRSDGVTTSNLPVPQLTSKCLLSMSSSSSAWPSLLQ